MISELDSQDLNPLRARLNLRAVLPCLAVLAENDARLKKLLGNSQFGVRFKLPNGLSTSLDFDKGCITIDADHHPFGQLKLRFLRDRHLNKLFANKGINLPAISGKLWHLPKMLRFKSATDHMQALLQPRPVENFNSHDLDLHVDLLMGTLIPAGVVELSKHEPTSKKAFEGFPNWTVQIERKQSPLSWIQSTDHRLEKGLGTAPQAPDAVLSFRDASTTALSIQGQLDPLAAVGNGQIQVRGLIPLVDTLNFVMDRLNLYLL